MFSEILKRDTFFNIGTPHTMKEGSQHPLLIWLHGWGDDPSCDILLETMEKSNSIGELPVVLFPWGLEGYECSEWTNRYDGSLSIENHIIYELIPRVQKKFPVYSFKQSIMIGGISMGGYGAINIGLKNQSLLCAAAATSPQGLEWPKELPLIEEKYPDFITEHIKGLSTPYENALKLWGKLPKNMDHLLQNSPIDYIDHVGVDIGIYIDVGNDGFENRMRQSALKFIKKLQSMKVAYVFEQFNGGHGSGLNYHGMLRKLQYLYYHFERKRDQQ